MFIFFVLSIISGGVLTPGAAFDGTDIYNRLADHELTFELANVS
jgi:hypothetical protein